MSADLMSPASVAEPVTAGKVIVVHSVKGGVGTTTVAVNVAAALHARGRRVCLVDLDLGCGDVAVALRLEPRNTIMDILSDDAAEEDVEPIDMLRTTVETGFHCILAPAQPANPAELPDEVLRDLIPYLSGLYDAIVIDTPATTSVHTRAALELADVLILVATPHVSALRGLTIGLDQAIAVGASQPLVVLNQVEKGVGMPVAEIAAGLGIGFALQVPRDPDVSRAGDRGEAMVKTLPTAPFSEEINRLVDRWCARPEPAGKPHPLHRRKGFKP